MDTSGGAQSTPNFNFKNINKSDIKNDKSDIKNFDGTINTTGGNLDDNFKIKGKNVKKEVKYIVDYLNKFKKDCSKCKSIAKNYNNEIDLEECLKYRIKYKDTILKHLFITHKIQDITITPINSSDNQNTITNFTSEYTQENKMEIPLEDIQPKFTKRINVARVDKSVPTTSFYQTVTTPQDNLGGAFPLRPPTTSVPLDMDIENTGKTTENEGEFKVPKTNKKRKASPPKDEIQTKNRYQILSDIESEEIQVTSDGNEENLPKRNLRKEATPTKATGGQARNPKSNLIKNVKTKTKSPPPIIMEGFHGKNSYNQLQKQLEEVLSKGYSLKYSKNNIVIYATDIEQYKQLKVILQQDTSIKWHTYATEAEKTHAFVAKGLDNEPDIEDIKQQLNEDYNIEVTKIYPMRTKYRTLYLVITPATVTLKHLKNVKYLSHVEVTWELRKKFSEIIQCKICYSWGHSASYCKHTPRCPNCGETHDIEEEPCQRTTKCANCKGRHKATDLNCENYKFRVGKLREMKDKNKKLVPRYVEASRPKENVWETRKNKFQQQKRNINSEYSSGDESTEAEEEAAASQRRPSNIRQRRMQKGNNTKEDPQFNSADTVSELLTLSKDFKLLGNSLNEAVRFLKDFLLIFKQTNKEDKAFAMLSIMLELNNYEF